jgi:hypothetical protein
VSELVGRLRRAARRIHSEIGPYDAGAFLTAAEALEAADRIEELERALWLIGEMKGKTLIGPYEMRSPEALAFSVGANQAFEQCADEARAVLGEKV